MTQRKVNVGVGLSVDADTAQAVRKATLDAMAQAGLQRADWAVCFFTTEHLERADTIQAAVLEQAGCLALCGCSAMGVIGAGREVERRPGVTVMVGRGEGFAAKSEMLPENGEGLGRFASLSGTPDGTHSTVIALADSFRVDNARLQRRLARDLPTVPVFGAGATDDGSMGVSLQVGMEGVRSASIATMGFYGDLQIAVGITQSCTAVGEPHFVTQAHDYVLVELDGRPALHTFIEQGRAIGLDDMQVASQELLFGFPLDRERPQFVGESCLVRPLAGFDQKSHGLVIPYPMDTNTTVGFMHRNPANAELDVRRMVGFLQDQLDGPPDFGFYFDCAARGRGLYGREGVDLEAIHGHFGPFPLLGMFGGYELATTHGMAHVYTYTGVLVLMRAA
ncbi:MAG TPA: FIST N-terminal domain-containing protein [bacterium]|nr:FIST N-terminal domain-containing protein [bacterium]